MFHVCVVDSVFEEMELFLWTNVEQTLVTDSSNRLESFNFISSDFQKRASAFERDVIR